MKNVQLIRSNSPWKLMSNWGKSSVQSSSLVFRMYLRYVINKIYLYEYEKHWSEGDDVIRPPLMLLTLYSDKLDLFQGENASTPFSIKHSIKINFLNDLFLPVILSEYRSHTYPSFSSKLKVCSLLGQKQGHEKSFPRRSWSARRYSYLRNKMGCSTRSSLG